MKQSCFRRIGFDINNRSLLEKQELYKLRGKSPVHIPDHIFLSLQVFRVAFGFIRIHLGQQTLNVSLLESIWKSWKRRLQIAIFRLQIIYIYV